MRKMLSRFNNSMYDQGEKESEDELAILDEQLV